MKERPILFSGEMVRAILDGRKTQTRRTMNPQPEHAQLYEYKGKEIYDGENRRWCWKNHVGVDSWEDITGQLGSECTYGQPGDRLWVRETFGCTIWDGPGIKNGRKPQHGDPILYRADPASAAQWGAGLPSQGGFLWRPSIFMPRWASRITLEVTEVRVERVQEISPEDVLAEGIKRGTDGSWLGPLDGFPDFPYAHAHEAFSALWDSINAKRDGGKFAWEANPYVWRLSFRRVKP